MNPYSFVPYPKRIQRTTPNYRDTFEGTSGAIECELEALSPFLVMDPRHRASPDRSGSGKFMRTNEAGTYIIPGTTLKGMVRSVAEVLSDSCVVTSSYKSRHLVPRELDHCSSSSRLCSACRIFGFLKGRDVLHGHINIGQARAAGDPPVYSDVQLVPLSSPRPEHEAFYGDKSNPAGRKFYFHQNQLSLAASENDRARGPWVTPLDKGARFNFTVTFENLTEEDLALLAASLVLTDDVRHKLGYGKPAGLGSVDVRINRVTIDDPDRYRTFNATSRIIESGSDDLAAWIREKKGMYFSNPTRPTKALVEILTYPQVEGVVYQYPGRAWFDDNPRTPLSETP